MYSFGQKEITTLFPLKWKADIGITTYRTNIIEDKGIIYIGSNGNDRNSNLDSRDGVYAIDPKTGAIIHQYSVPFAGDDDVTGIAIGDEKLFFGTDNYYFFCFDLKTHQEIWKYPLPNDVESAPVLADFNNDNILDVAFNVQFSGMYVLNGINGELIWVNGEIGSHDGNVSPQLYDINKDGVMDIISSGRGEPNSNEINGFKMAHYGDYHFALDGKNGTLLWAVETGAGTHSTPFILKKKESLEIYFLDCYGELNVVNEFGKVIKTSGFGYGNFSSPIITNDEHLVIGDYSIEINEKYYEPSEDSTYSFLTNKAKSNDAEIEGKISATTMVADVLGKGYSQLIGVSESGILFISKTDGTVIHKFKIPTGSEASVFIKDLDGDHKLEIIVADLNGTIYCYKTNSTGKVERGQFKL